MSPNADVHISAILALKCLMIANMPILKKKCRYADIADADINIGTPLDEVTQDISKQGILSLTNKK